jgi:hypothetical protein
MTVLARPSSNLTDQSALISVESLRREFDVGVGWSPARKDASPEAEERPPLEAVTEQRD